MSLYNSILGLSGRLMTQTFRYIRRTENFSRFRESRGEFLETIYEVPQSLTTPSTGANTVKYREGSMDLGGGSVMLHAKFFEDIGMIVDGKLVAQDNTDHLEIDGTRYEITKVEVSGWDWVAKKYILVMINYRQFLNSN